jgi:hypothetical protein
MLFLANIHDLKMEDFIPVAVQQADLVNGIHQAAEVNL